MQYRDQLIFMRTGTKLRELRQCATKGRVGEARNNFPLALKEGAATRVARVVILHSEVLDKVVR